MFATTLEECIITPEEIQVLNDVAHKCHMQAKIMGWHKRPREDGTRFALIHSEISEALEANRKTTMDDHLPHRCGEEVELADAVIRIFDHIGLKGMDIGAAMAEKGVYNQNRADHQLANRNLAGGKQY